MLQNNEYAVLVLDYDQSFEPKAWSDNPGKGRFRLCVEPVDLAKAQEFAKDFNEQELEVPNRTWAVVTPANGGQYEDGQVINVESNYLLN
jgi:hypothetical protein